MQTTQHSVKLKDISTNPGDIFFTRSKSAGSWLIRCATLSKWSHVGIALGNNSVLEAVKKDKNQQIRVVHIEEFANNASAMRYYARPDSLTEDQVAKMETFVNSMTGKDYTALHAGLTMTIPIIRIFYSGIATAVLLACVGIQGMNYQLIGVILGIEISIFLMYCLTVWSIRTKLAVKETENFFRKIHIGRLVDFKQNMFCSKLVTCAERAIGGDLANHLPKDESEAQPEHVAKACKRLGWQKVDVRLPNTVKS